MLRAVARLGLVIALAAPTVVLSASPCAACSCVAQTPKQLLRHADAAFVGTVVDEQAIDAVTTVQTFDVEDVFKGALGPTVQVIAPIGSGGGNTCGVLFPRDTSVAVVLERQGDGWTSSVCSMVSPAELRRIAHAHEPIAEPTGSATPAATSAPAPGPSGGLGWQAIVLGLLLAVAAIALALSLGGRRGRERGNSPLEADRPADHDSPADPPGSSR